MRQYGKRSAACGAGRAEPKDQRTASTYIFGLPGNAVLDRLVDPIADDVRVRGDNLGECRIASSRNAPERAGHCLTRMLPWPDPLVNLGGSAKPAFLFDRRQLSRPDLALPEPRRATQGMGGAEPPGATRSAIFRASMARMASTGPSPQ